MHKYLEPDDQGNTTLHLMASSNHDPNEAGLKKILSISKSCDVNKTNHEGYTPLHRAAADDKYLKKLKMLITYGANITIHDKKNYTPLHIACLNNCKNNFILLANHLENDDEMSLDQKEEILNQQDENGQTLLHYAVSHNELDLVRLLLRMEANPYIFDHNGNSPINLALNNNYQEIFKIFHDKIVSFAHFRETDEIKKLFPLTKDGYTRFEILINNQVEEDEIKNLPEIKLILDQKDKDGLTPLHYAIKKGDMKFISLLIDLGADLAIVDHYADNPVMYALRIGNFAALDLITNKLKSSNNNIDNYLCFRSLKGKNLLHKLIDLNDTESQINKLLTLAPSLIIQKNEFGLTPLNLAIERKKYNYVALILKSGVDLKKISNDSNTTRYLDIPLFMAIYKQDYNMVKLLIDNGADVNEIYDNISPLRYAVNFPEGKKIVELLINQGANLNIRDNKGLRPIDYIMKKGFDHLASCFGVDENLVRETSIHRSLFTTFGEKSDSIFTKNEEMLFKGGTYLEAIAMVTNALTVCVKNTDKYQELFSEINNMILPMDNYFNNPDKILAQLEIDKSLLFKAGYQNHCFYIYLEKNEDAVNVNIIDSHYDIPGRPGPNVITLIACLSIKNSFLISL